MQQQERKLGFKIKHIKTGLYLSKLYSQKWTKIGKVWPRESDLIRAVNLAIANKKRSSKMGAESILNDIANWEVIELSESSRYSAMFLIDKVKY